MHALLFMNTGKLVQQWEGYVLLASLPRRRLLTFARCSAMQYKDDSHSQDDFRPSDDSKSSNTSSVGPFVFVFIYALFIALLEYPASPKNYNNYNKLV